MTVDPLTESEYASVFRTFISGSTEYEQIRTLARPFIDGLEGKAIDLMSIGAGTGCLEDDFIHELGLKVATFLAIEPNSDHLSELKQTVSKWGDVKLKIDSQYFDDKYETSSKFDMVLMSHSMYCVNNPTSVILKAKSFLKPNGRLFLISQTEKGGHELFARMMEVVTMNQPINDHFVTSKGISEALVNNAIKHQVKMGPSHLEVTDFIERRNSPTANDVVTFFLQTDYSKLEKLLQDEIYEMVKERSVQMKDGKHMFCHPTGMIVVENA